jgi:hypothetical protein
MYIKILQIFSLSLNFSLLFSCTFALRNSGAFIGEIRDKSAIENKNYCDMREAEIFSREINKSFEYRNSYYEIGHNTGQLIDYILIFAVLFDYPYRLSNYLISLFYGFPIFYDENKNGTYLPPYLHIDANANGWVKIKLNDCTKNTSNLFVINLENVCPEQKEKTPLYENFIQSNSLTTDSLKLYNSFFYDKFIEINSFSKKDKKKIEFLIGNPDMNIKKDKGLCKTRYKVYYSGGLEKLLQDLKAGQKN